MVLLSYLQYCLIETMNQVISLLPTLQMKGRWESDINGWFPFTYSQNWSCYLQNRINMFSLPVPTLIYLWEIYIFPGLVCLFCWRKYVDRSWEYINHSQTHECGNWDWGRAIPRKEVHKRDFPCSVLPQRDHHSSFFPPTYSLRGTISPTPSLLPTVSES